jgi:uncharacterized protein (TIGR03067 family)
LLAPGKELLKTPSDAPGMTDDLKRLQGKWRRVSVKSAAGVRKPEADNPRDLEVEIRGNVILFPPNDGADKGKPPETTIWRLDPSKTPKEIDLVEPTGIVSRGIYDIRTDDGRTTLVWSFGRGFRPSALGHTPEDVYETTLNRVGVEKPAAPAPPGNVPEERFGLVEQMAEQLAAEVRKREKPRTPDDFRLQLDRARARVDQMRSMIEEAERSLEKAGETARLTRPGGPTGGRLDAEVDLAVAALRLERARHEAKYERLNLLCAETDAIRAKERLAAVGNPGRAIKGVTVVDGQGRAVEPDPKKSNLVQALDWYPVLVLGTCRAEMTRNPDGTPAATAAMWEKLVKAGHVRVRYAEPRVFRDIAYQPEVPVEEFLIPMTDATLPSYVLTRHGTTYRAFAGYQDWTAEWLQGALRNVR